MTDKAVRTRQETADYLNISLSLLDKVLTRRDNPLPCIRVGRRIVILADQLEEWLHAEQERQTEVI